MIIIFMIMPCYGKRNKWTKVGITFQIEKAVVQAI